MADLDVIVINYRTPGDLAAFLRSLEFHAGQVSVKVWIGNVAPRFEDVRVAEEWRETTTLDADHVVFDDNIGFALKLAKVPKEEIDTRVRKAAAILELETYLDRKPGQLSCGQRQRVADVGDRNAP